jgi:hypothetical protein
LKVTEVLVAEVAGRKVIAEVMVLVMATWANPLLSRRRVPVRVTDPTLVVTVEIPVRVGELLALR